jgi:hydroxymethylpyrimidine kinase/phosphomethylpyrimidine kinase
MAAKLTRAQRLVPTVCSIGSTDPTGGAGLFADARLFARLGVGAAFVVAGVTAQNSRSVTKVNALAPAAIRAQLQSVWSQMQPAAVLVGLVPGAAALRAVARFLRASRQGAPIVVDPVIAATSGYQFLRARDVGALRALVGLSTIATPNVAEAAALSGIAIRKLADAARAASALAKSAHAILVTGGHLRGAHCTDVLATHSRVHAFSARRLDADMRGAGGILAASIAAQLARGMPLERAIRSARAEVRKQMRRARPMGGGRPQLV